MKSINNILQMMRGICIIAVMLTHIIDKRLENPNYEISMFIQNIINYAVTGFIFLAGYFVNIEKVKNNSNKFIKKRLQRILIPYILWSCFYIIFNIIIYNQKFSYIVLIEMFLLGKASGHLYYCVLYILFILITPFIVKNMESKLWNFIFYATMPLWFIIIYYMQLFKQINYSNWSILPVSWFLYYYIGLKWKNMQIKSNIFIIIFVILSGFVLELIESLILFSMTKDTFFSVTPLRYSVILYVIAIILLFLQLKNSKSISNKVLIELGNNSFGIYLSHIVTLGVISFLVKKIICFEDYYIFSIIVILIISMLICNAIINISKRFIPDKYLKYIGFS